MFGNLIKSIRRDNGYTQKELVTKLQLASNEFSNVDYVTVSRWERGVTTPNPAKAIRILRCFILDVMPFIKSLDIPLGFEQADSFLYHRFESNLQQHLLAALEYDAPTQLTEVHHDKLLLSVRDPILDNIKSFHKRWNATSNDLFRLDLFLYQEENKLIGYRFFDSKNEGKLLGFSMGMLFRNEVLAEQVVHNKDDVNFSLASSYNTKSTFALYIFSGTILNRYVFISLWRLRLRYLISHSNVTEIYCNVRQKSVASFLETLGFVIVSTNNETSVGEIRIGNRYYDGCVMKVDTSIFLTRKEVLSQNELA